MYVIGLIQNKIKYIIILPLIKLQELLH